MSLRAPSRPQKLEFIIMHTLRNSRLSVHVLHAGFVVLIGAMESNAWGIDNQPYSGCGFLTFGVECPRFVGDDGTTFSIPGTGGFGPGDYVRVEGEICITCPSICQEGPVFHTNTITTCFAGPPKHLFDQCGTLVLTPNPGACLLFESKGELYWVENLKGFGPGDFVRVISDNVTAPCFVLCTANVAACVEDNQIRHCIAPPLFVDSCGTLVEHPIGTAFCVVFHDDQGNDWLLQDQGSFKVGDRLHVMGPAVFCTPLCGNVIGCIMNDPPVGCTGDVNSDGQVNVDDLIALILGWGPCPVPPPPCAADADNDGDVDVDDLLLVIMNWT
jgi:hypothetical protein